MKYTFTILCFFLVVSVFGQDYKNSAGLRLGKTDGLTYKRFMTENGAVEFMLGFGGYNQGTQIYGTYQWNLQIPVPFTENLYWYYGVGGHVGYIKAHDERNYYLNDSTTFTDDKKKSYYAIGIDGVIGVEYRIFTVPMTVSMEVKPYVEYYGLRYIQFRSWDFGFAVKYIF